MEYKRIFLSVNEKEENEGYDFTTLSCQQVLHLIMFQIYCFCKKNKDLGWKEPNSKG